MQPLTADSGPQPARRLRSLWTLALLCAAVTLPARAQWQRGFGAPGTNERGATVAAVPSGGYIAAGNTDDETYGYVVRTDASGATIWDRIFHNGAATVSQFRGVKVCANGDFVLVGSIGSATRCFAGCQHILVMRINANGAIVWQRMIGDNSYNYDMAAVVETQFGNGTTTHPGDIVIGGTAGDYGAHDLDGVIVRLSADGDMIWWKRYDIDPATTSEAHLTGIDETQVSPNAGDIIATGYGFFAPGGADELLLRLDGSNGEFTGSPRGAAAFAGIGDEFGYGITELRNGAFAGDLVTAGGTSASVGLGYFGMLMLETHPDPCDPMGQRADNTLGDPYNSITQALALCEITDPALGTPGDVVAAGYARDPIGFDYQATMQQFSAGTMSTAGAHHSYGVPNNLEVGYGVAEYPSALGSPGFVLTGQTGNPGTGGGDLYLLTTDAAMASCNATAADSTNRGSTLHQRCLSITPTVPDIKILCGVQALPTDWGNDICSTDNASKRSVDPASPDLSSRDNAAPLLLQPNPVRRGDRFTIDCGSTITDRTEIAVSDVAGHVVYSRTEGAVSEPVDIATDRWEPGTYLIRVVVNGTSRTGRVTITAR